MAYFLQFSGLAAKTAAKRKAASPAGPSDTTSQQREATAEDRVAAMGLQPSVRVQLYYNDKGQLVNQFGVRVDALGRPTRPRGGV